MKKDKHPFLKLMRKIRRGEDYTQEQLADKVKVGRSFLAQVESGQRKPSLELCEKIAGKLGININIARDYWHSNVEKEFEAKTTSTTPFKIHKIITPKKAAKQKK